MLVDVTKELETARAAAAGDPIARETIVRTHYESIHRLARHLSRSHAEAPDLAQQTFIKACRHIGRFDGRSTMKAWLIQILMREFSHWRRARRLFAELREHVAPDRSEQILDREILLNAIHRLPSPMRAAFLLVELNGLSVVEAAAALNIPEGTVKSRLSHARTRLRRQLADSGSPTPKEVTNES